MHSIQNEIMEYQLIKILIEIYVEKSLNFKTLLIATDNDKAQLTKLKYNYNENSLNNQAVDRQH